jgi:hypothetical protein
MPGTADLLAAIGDGSWLVLGVLWLLISIGACLLMAPCIATGEGGWTRDELAHLFPEGTGADPTRRVPPDAIGGALGPSLEHACLSSGIGRDCVPEAVQRNSIRAAKHRAIASAARQAGRPEDAAASVDASQARVATTRLRVHSGGLEESRGGRSAPPSPSRFRDEGGELT